MSEYPFRHRLRVRYNECDPQNVVFNANYFTYFDIAITELWRAAFGSYEAMLASGVDMMVVEARARYRAPARFDDELEISTRIARLGGTSMTTELLVTSNGTTVAEGELTHVFVDPDAQRKREVPDGIRQGLEPYLASD